MIRCLNKKNIILLVLCCLFLISCKTTEYVEVPVEVEKIKTEYKVLKDSIYLHDSISVYTENKGDTVYITKFKYKLKTVCKTDTVIKVDSIPVITEVKKTIEVNKLKSWLKVLMSIGGVGIALLLGGLLTKFKVWKLLF